MVRDKYLESKIVRNSSEYVVTFSMGAARLTLRHVFSSKKVAQEFAKQYNKEHKGANARAKSRNGYFK